MSRFDEGRVDPGGIARYPADAGGMRAFYLERLDRLTLARDSEGALSTRLGWSRVMAFLLGFALYVVLDVTSGRPAAWAAGGLALAGGTFVWLVVWHRRVRRRERRLAVLAEINRVALARLGREWSALPESTIEPPGPAHPYAMDIDVCGEGSLFRLLTTPTLPVGRATLREWLLSPAPTGEVLRRQEAVAELAGRVDLLQTLEATGRAVESPDPEAIETFLAWAEEEPWLAHHRWLLVGARGLPLLTGALGLLHFTGVVGGAWWLLSLGAAFSLATIHGEKIRALMEAASGGQERFARYAALLTQLLEMNVEAPILREAQEAVRSSPVGATRELIRLGRRAGWADIRLSVMAHAPLQALFAWDIHTLAGLERWKRRSGQHVRSWLEALGRLEALAALSTLKADHPGWSFPRVDPDAGMKVEAVGLGHPLLPSGSCVANDVRIGPPGSFLFVTGSNMSGKSTLLRAVGLNAALAQAGGPVCADGMTLPPVRIFTSMRTADSLAEGVSQYMAELKRIKQVVDGAREAGEAGVLYLLDEPLQGTNEAERRVAVQTILGHLLDAGAIGAVATHDLHLDETPVLRAAARPVHLEGQVREGDRGPLITFDFRLREGRASSTNALALLRAVGLGEPGPPTTLPPNPR